MCCCKTVVLRALQHFITNAMLGAVDVPLGQLLQTALSPAEAAKTKNDTRESLPCRLFQPSQKDSLTAQP